MTLATPQAITVSKWTVAEYHRMVHVGILDDRHVELLQGAIVEMPPEGKPHAHLSTDAADYLRELLRGQAKIRDSKPITLPNQSELEPDLAVIQDLGDVYLAHHPYPENIFWVIEYANSSLRKDLEIKTKIYVSSLQGESSVIAQAEEVSQSGTCPIELSSEA